MSERLRAGPLTVAVLAGGRSAEREISLSSGSGVRDGLLASGHQVLWVEIDEHGCWRHEGSVLSVTPGEGLLALPWAGIGAAIGAIAGLLGDSKE